MSKTRYSNLAFYRSVAQLVEHSSPKRVVAGSSPVTPAVKYIVKIRARVRRNQTMPLTHASYSLRVAEKKLSG